MITKSRFEQLEQILRSRGYGPTISWSEEIWPPSDADEFARRVIYVICNGGMRVMVGAANAAKCIAAIEKGRSAAEVFGHPGKARAIDEIWKEREQLFARYSRASVKLDFLAELPWIGEVTKLHLAKNLGASAAKPDVHLVRLANREGTTPARLCRRLSRLTGLKVTTIDTVLWRACADGILNSRKYELEGWYAGFVGDSPQELHEPQGGPGS